MAEKYFFYKFALKEASLILESFKHLALSGSVARILVGLESERNVGDLDFCINQTDFNKFNYAKRLQNGGWHPSNKTKLVVPGDYTHYRNHSGLKKCVFVIPDTKIITVNGLRTQNVGDLIYWKQQFIYFRSHEKVLTDLEREFIDIPF